MSSTRYVEWVHQKVEEEDDRAKECFDGQVAISAVDIVKTEAGTKKNAKIVRRGGVFHQESMELRLTGQLWTKQWMRLIGPL